MTLIVHWVKATERRLISTPMRVLKYEDWFQNCAHNKRWAESLSYASGIHAARFNVWRDTHDNQNHCWAVGQIRHKHVRNSAYSGSWNSMTSHSLLYFLCSHMCSKESKYLETPHELCKCAWGLSFGCHRVVPSGNSILRLFMISPVLE